MCSITFISLLNIYFQYKHDLSVTERVCTPSWHHNDVILVFFSSILYFNAWRLFAIVMHWYNSEFLWLELCCLGPDYISVVNKLPKKHRLVNKLSHRLKIHLRRIFSLTLSKVLKVTEKWRTNVHCAIINCYENWEVITTCIYEWKIFRVLAVADTDKKRVMLI